MMKIEFENLCNELNGGNNYISEENYEIIQTVYMYYPNIENKKDIVKLYLKYGMIIIKDMMNRSIKIKEIEDKIFEEQRVIDALKNELEMEKSV